MRSEANRSFLFLCGVTTLLFLSAGCTRSNLAPSSPKSPNSKEGQIAEDLEARAKKAKKREGLREASRKKLEKKPEGTLALIDEHALEGLDHGETQMDKVCKQNVGKTNIVIQKFCIEKIRPKSLVELQAALGFNFVTVSADRDDNGANGNPAFAFQGHSSSLVGSFTSSINPRVVIMSPELLDNNTINPNFVVMGFVRGEQFVEIIVNNGDPDGDLVQNLALFLVAFKQACNKKKSGCSPGELLTPAVESNWTEFTIYSADDLKNTIADCLQCHQPEGPGTAEILRMQELRNPWTHWFRDNTDGQALIDDYYAAHGQDEVYGGVPGIMIQASDPQKLENLVRGNGFQELQVGQAEFPTRDIADEINAANPAQPQDNTIPGVSPTWEQLYQLSVRGVSADGRTVIPIPYHDVKVTEPSLLAKYTQQYQGFKQGAVSTDEFEDHRNVLKLDQREKADMGFALRAEATPEEMLTLACAQCHNSKLDQDISRSLFDVNLAEMGDRAKEEIDVAIERLTLGYSPEALKKKGVKFVDEKGKEIKLHKGEHLLTMPPRRFKTLTDDQIDQLIKYLKEEKAKL